jgi:hypothetical protein
MRLSVRRRFPTRAPKGLATGVVALLLLLGVVTPAWAAGGWTSTGSMTLTRYLHTATLLPDGQVLAAGGTGPDELAAPSTEVYNPATRGWSSGDSMSVPREDHTATLLTNGKVLVVGGVHGFGPARTVEASAEVYDPVTGAWSSTGSMASPRVKHAATLLADGQVLVAGGADADAATATTSAELYDPATGRWSDAASMAVPRSDHTATLLPSGKVLMAGGGGAGPATQADSAELFDPATGTWSRTGDLVNGRELHTATLMPNGRVLVAGGSFSDSLASAELYDPATGRWTSTGDLAAARQLHTATLLPDGHVLVAGGYPGPTGNGDATAEMYDATTRSWSSAGTMTTRRFYHATSLLRDGSVLVVGGRRAGATAEIFTTDGGADDAPPVTTATMTPAPNAAGWNRVPVTVTLRAVDGGSGVASISYSATGAQSIPSTTVAGDQATVTVGKEGVTTLTYAARDRAGNQEPRKAKVVRVDRTAPVLRIKDLTVPATGPKGAIIDRYPVSATDRLDPNPVVRCSPPTPLTVPIQPFGTATTVVCTATDRAGNVVGRTLRIHVAGAAEQLSALQAQVARVAPSREVERRLHRDLRRAGQALDHAEPERACNSLDTFARHVAKYRHKGTLTVRQADRLIADAVRITDVLDCS